MLATKVTGQYFHGYFAEWMAIYKQGAVRPVTYQKYLVTLRRLVELAPSLRLSELDKRSYQTLINEYAITHEKQTTMDFHHHLKGAILDAIDEGLLSSDPTRKVVIKGKEPSKKKPKFLSQFELQSLLKNLNLADAPNWVCLSYSLPKQGRDFRNAWLCLQIILIFRGTKSKSQRHGTTSLPKAGSGKRRIFLQNAPSA